METAQDIINRIVSEITHYNVRHAMVRGSLWYMPTTAERDGGIMAIPDDRPAPAGYLFLSPIRRELSAKDNAKNLSLTGAIGRLPVLSLTRKG